MSISTTLAGLKTASELTVRLREALKSRDVKLDEVAARIIEVQDLISDGRTALIDAQEELLTANRENQKLKDELKQERTLKADYLFRENMYWHRETNEGPFCSTCFDSDRKLVRLTDFDGSFYCVLHKQSF